MASFLSVLNVILFNIIIPLLILGVFIFVHELGHFLSARMMRAEVKEFAIGMGPKVFSVKSKKYKTVYAIRAIPMGGAVTMAGEDEQSDSENALYKKPVWKRFIILAAGSFMNFLLGFIIMAVIVSGAKGFYSMTVSRFDATATSNNMIMEGDKILKVNGKTINIYNDLAYELIREGKDPVNVTVLRGDKKIVLYGVQFPTATDSGMTYGTIDFTTEVENATLPLKIKQTFYQSLSTINMTWSSFFDLVTGKYGVDQISGPVGGTQTIGNSARDVAEGKTGGSATGFLFLIALITMNLGVVNLLPLPALDGGRIVFLIIELIRRKPIKPEYEGYVHLAGFAILILFMIFITYKDILRLIVG